LTNHRNDAEPDAIDGAAPAARPVTPVATV